MPCHDDLVCTVEFLPQYPVGHHCCLCLSSSPLPYTLHPHPWWNWYWGLALKSNAVGLAFVWAIMMIMALMANNNNAISRFLEIFLCEHFDQNISCVLFWAFIEYSPLGGRYYSLSLKCLYSVNKDDRHSLHFLPCLETCSHMIPTEFSCLCSYTLS